MDLRTLLNTDAAAHKTPEIPSQSTFDRPVQTPSRTTSLHNPAEVSLRDRPSPYPPPPRPPAQRSPNGSHFGPPSPYQSTSASTWSAGGLSSHSQSPGGLGQPYTPRDGLPPQQAYNPSFAPSPSPLASQPPTPNAIYYQQNYPPQTAQPSALPPPSFGAPPTRETSLPPNGFLPGQTRHVSPTSQFQPQPTAPLGPPAQFQRPSSQVQRPPSRDYDHYRSYSSGSISSIYGREAVPNQVTSPNQLRRESLQRYSMERERSISVSPKTIPQPSPYRQQSVEIQRQAQITPPVYVRSEPDQSMSNSITPAETQTEHHHTASTPQSASQTPKEAHITPKTNSARPSPAPTSQILTPKSAHMSLPASESPQVQRPHTLKRNASLVSSMSVSSQPPRKKLRRDEIPVFARSARLGRSLRLRQSSTKPAASAAQIPTRLVPATQSVNGSQTSNGSTPQGAPQQLAEAPWEPSITNKTPYEDLTRRICDWIVEHIGIATPPSGGAMFEIEAKIGEIFDFEGGDRLRLPVETEAVFNKNVYRRTKFESSMDMEQHKQLNEFLNGLVGTSLQESHNSNRTPIYFDHPRESDEFFELKPAGVANLPPAIRQYLNPHHKPRVRRTIDDKTGKVKAQIIKSRIADLEVYNPGCDFDYRISISVESPWQGDFDWLEPTTESGSGGGRERKKDRMSYRHMAYQIDLTQVSYTNKADKEHELEVEISTEQIRRELENLRLGRESRYEDLVRGFLDNVRILCRQGTVRRK